MARPYKGGATWHAADKAAARQRAHEYERAAADGSASGVSGGDGTLGPALERFLAAGCVPHGAPYAAYVYACGVADRSRGFVLGPWQNMRHDMPLACTRAGIARCTSNDLRRSFASWLVQSGVPLATVAKLLGHRSTKLVERVYGHLADKNLTDAIGRL